MITDQEALKALRSGKVQAEHAGNYWSKEDREKLCQLFGANCSISQIAVEMGRTERAVFNQLDKAGLFNPQSKPRGRRACSSEGQYLCPDCNVKTCQNHGRECAHAGNV